MDKRWSPIWLDFSARAGVEEQRVIVQRLLRVPAQGPEQTVGTISLNSHLFTIRLAHSSSDAVGDPIPQVSRSNLR